MAQSKTNKEKMPTTSTNGTSTRRRRTTSKSGVDDAQARVRAAESVDPKTREAAKARRAKVQKDVAEMSVTKAADAVAKAKVQVSQSLDSLTDSLNEKLEDLRKVNEEKEAVKQELQQLHDNDAVLSSTAELLENHNNIKAQLLADITTVKEAWVKEQNDHDISVAERDSDMNKERKRSEEDYDYNLKMTRRSEAEIFQAEVKRRNIAEEDRQRALSKSWNEREAAIQESEKKHAEFKEKLENFDATVKAAVDKQVAIVTNSQKRDHKVEVERLTMQHDADNRVAKLELDNLTKANSEKDAQIQRLQIELNTAKNQITDLANQAMVTAGGKQALTAVNESLEKLGSNKK